MITIATLTTEDIEDIKPFEIFIDNTSETGLDEPSKIQISYPYTVDKKLRLIKCLGKASKEIMTKAKKAWNLSFD